MPEFRFARFACYETQQSAVKSAVLKKMNLQMWGFARTSFADVGFW